MLNPAFFVIISLFLFFLILLGLAIRYIVNGLSIGENTFLLISKKKGLQQ
ncbi:hypothetical protein SAMN05660900_01853 [Megasphaera cerevisiae DSM 20462]|nr:hypothetical protein SAMN05660900_01853 [Megasphaera cerevisiae DSM 20462]